MPPIATPDPNLYQEISQKQKIQTLEIKYMLSNSMSNRVFAKLIDR